MFSLSLGVYTLILMHSVWLVPAICLYDLLMHSSSLLSSSNFVSVDCKASTPLSGQLSFIYELLWSLRRWKNHSNPSCQLWIYPSYFIITNHCPMRMLSWPTVLAIVIISIHNLTLYADLAGCRVVDSALSTLLHQMYICLRTNSRACQCFVIHETESSVVTF